MGFTNVLTLIFTGPAKIEKAHAENEEACKKLLQRMSSKKLDEVLESVVRPNGHDKKVVKLTS